MYLIAHKNKYLTKQNKNINGRQVQGAALLLDLLQAISKLQDKLKHNIYLKAQQIVLNVKVILG